MRCPDLDLVWISIFMIILLNCLKPPGKIVVSILIHSLELIWALIYLLVYCWTGRVVDCICQCTIELITKAETYSFVGKGRRDSPSLDEDVTFIGHWDATLIWLETRLLWNVNVILDASVCEPHLLEMRMSRWIILDADVVRNVGLLSATRQLILSSRFAPHISAVGNSIKDLGLSTINSLDCSSSI